MLKNYTFPFIVFSYERLSTLGATGSGNKTVTFDETFSNSIDEIVQKYNGAFTHPLIDDIVANLM